VSGGSDGMPVGERIVEVVRPVRRSVDQAERYLRAECEFLGGMLGSTAEG